MACMSARVAALAALLAVEGVAGAQTSADSTKAAALRFRHELMDTAARKFGRYPPAALEAGLKGKAVIRLDYAASGKMRGIAVQESSGHQILDDAALDTVIAAVGAEKIPAELRGKEFSVDIPVIYQIDVKGKP